MSAGLSPSQAQRKSSSADPSRHHGASEQLLQVGSWEVTHSRVCPSPAPPRELTGMPAHVSVSPPVGPQAVPMGGSCLPESDAQGALASRFRKAAWPQSPDLQSNADSATSPPADASGTRKPLAFISDLKTNVDLITFKKLADKSLFPRDGVTPWLLAPCRAAGLR